MASLRAALFFSVALALVLSSQARPLEDVSPLGSLEEQLGARHLLLTTEPCCSLYKKTSPDLASFASQARTLLTQQSNLLTSLITQPAIRQAIIDLMAKADRTLTDEGSQLFNNKCLTQTQSNTFGKNLVLARNIGSGVKSLNAINGLNINLLGIRSFGNSLIQALQTFASQSDAIGADLTKTAKALSGCSA